MSKKCVLNVDLADVWQEKGRKTFLRTIAWGDEITVTKESGTHLETATLVYQEQPDGTITSKPITGYIEPKKSSGLKPFNLIKPSKDNEVLKVNVVDVQQGDGSVIETPDGKVILVDGGDNQMFARYLAARFRNTTASKPLDIECIIVTHGDADHFAGLTEIFKSENNNEQRKRLFMQPKRVFHNGIVKRPSTVNKKTVPEDEILGPTKKVGDRLYVVGLEDDLLKVNDSEMNQPFRNWKEALVQYNKRRKVEMRRLQFGDDKAFGFLSNENIRIEILGPLTETVSGKPALKLLGKPQKGPRIGHESVSVTEEGFKGYSASHTINGHSIVFRLIYGGFSYLFSGDLNDEASRFLAREHNKGTLNLRSEIFKVPHHGSADFSGGFFQAVSPIVSIVSSGDESAKKEYIHPRATLMGALGKWARVSEPLIFVTELVAFFKVEKWSRPVDDKEFKKRGQFFGFSRAAYGMVKTRTDGKRLLVYTDSGNIKMKEAYAYQLDASGVPQPAEVVRV